MLKFAVLAAYAAVSAAGLTMMKLANPGFTPTYVAGFGLYGLGFLMWMLVILPMLPLSIAFPISAGAIVIATLVTGNLFLGEALTIDKAVGALLVIAGITTLFYRT